VEEKKRKTKAVFRDLRVGAVRAGWRYQNDRLRKFSGFPKLFHVGKGKRRENSFFVVRGEREKEKASHGAGKAHNSEGDPFPRGTGRGNPKALSLTKKKKKAHHSISRNNKKGGKGPGGMVAAEHPEKKKRGFPLPFFQEKKKGRKNSSADPAVTRKKKSPFP